MACGPKAALLSAAGSFGGRQPNQSIGPRGLNVGHVRPPVPNGGSARLDRSGRSPQAPRPQAAPFRYCASANIPPAKECHHELLLIGRFSTLTAISATPPNT